MSFFTLKYHVGNIYKLKDKEKGPDIDLGVLVLPEHLHDMTNIAASLFANI